MKEVFKTNDGRIITIVDHRTKVALQAVTIERKADGGWIVKRLREGGGESFSATDLADAFAIVFAAYDTVGMPRITLADTPEAKCGALAPDAVSADARAKAKKPKTRRRMIKKSKHGASKR